MWKYIKYNTDFGNHFDLHFNKARYGNYGYVIRKDTIFLSNVKMNLKYEKFIPPYYTEIVNGKTITIMKDNPEMKVKGRAFDFVKKGVQKSKAFSTRQVSEIGEHSNIPNDLIREIFSYFIIVKGEKMNLSLKKYMNEWVKIEISKKGEVDGFLVIDQIFPKRYAILNKDKEKITFKKSQINKLIPNDGIVILTHNAYKEYRKNAS